MGFFDRLFGKMSAPAPGNRSEGDHLPSSGSMPIQGPPEFVRAAEMQRAYWTQDAQEQSRLETRDAESLDWRERLRLHHLICLQRLTTEPGSAAEGAAADAAAKCRRSVHGLIAADSPYRPRVAMIWQGSSAPAGATREPDMQGELLNPSLTHLGCLEVYRVDAANQPTQLDFVSFDALSGVVFAPPNLIRAAKLFYEDGRAEIVLVPLLYGLTWSIGNEFERTGRMTRFEAHLDDAEMGALGASGIGVGQQDFSVRRADGGSRLLGLGSVAEITFPLDLRDPRFEEKARTRGIDPDEIRRNLGGASGATP